ncbi:MAG: four-carbon acid sugar kinase family protein [Firmicutes bacterium]|nr:four-carbon acid sugar kinase family protein [Bacillota bacterium]
MIKLAVIADDFTGALDTGIKFGQSGARTRMFIGTGIDFDKLSEDCEVIIVDTETRHLSPQRSYEIIYNLVRHCSQNGVRRFYKKTDSALRGCVGTELAAMSDALERPVHFAPALPAENRYTKDGIQYINGVPVSKSVFGKDPFEPVTEDRVSDILRIQAEIDVISVPSGSKAEESLDRGVYVYDAASEEDLRQIGGDVKEAEGLVATAGCAGFAQIVRELVFEERGKGVEIPRTDGLFVVCGTLNAKTLDQLAYAEEHGFSRIVLSPKQKLMPGYLSTQEGRAFLDQLKEKCSEGAPVIVDVDPINDPDDPAEMARENGIDEESLRMSIADRLGKITELWLGFGYDYTLILSGGDTAYGFLNRLGIREVVPVGEVLQGAVMFQIEVRGRTLNVVSKSGGFGSEDFFVRAAEILIK